MIAHSPALGRARGASTSGVRLVGTLLGASMLIAAQNAYGAPGNAPISVASYNRLVASYDRAISSGRRLSPTDARSFEVQFLAARNVRLADGTMLTLNNSAETTAMNRIASTPNGSEPDEDTRSRASLLDHLVNPGKDIFRPRADAGDIARGIVAGYGYDRPAKAMPEPKLTWLKNWLNGIASAVDRFFDWLFGGNHAKKSDTPSLSGLAAFVRFFFIALLVIVAAAACAFIGVKLYQNRDRFRRRRVRPIETGLDLGPDEIGDPIAAAHRLAERGDFRGAIRLAYIASLRALAESGSILISIHKTNWEYQRDLAARDAAKATILRPGTMLFDRVWYGHQNGSQAEFMRIVDLYELLALGEQDPRRRAADGVERLTTAATDAR